MIADDIKIVLFDAVGTVMFPQPDIAQAYVDIGSRYIDDLEQEQVLSRFKQVFSQVFSAENSRIPVTEESTLAAWVKVVEGTFPDFKAAGGELFQELWDHFASSQAWRVYDDVKDCFKRLSSRGFQLGIASNFDSRLEGIVQRDSVLSQVQYVFHSAHLGWNKPARGFCHGITQRLAVPAKQIVLIGDRLDNDIQPALEAGWQGVWIDRTSTGAGIAAMELPEVSRIVTLDDLC
ncbi:MAG: HAD-IA family hydrolase [Pirellulales bacterium]|nr:hypothetical protein [Rhodopirellula sp.]MCH2371707.1 HAD-IA family hydrolase [Pirellulales bacterium]|tara:strand:+ start:1003 stop:1704 length:702 start_codon:yes stop_codon:yes gene_type:complete